MANHYEVLEVAKTATAKEIKKAYYRLAKLYHPDHNQGDPQAAEKFKAVGEAYKVLSNETSRAAYDQELAAGPVKPTGPSGQKAAGAAPSRPRPRTEGTATGIDFGRMRDNFAAFYGFDPKSKEVTDEAKLGTYVPKEKKRNPLDMSDMFERFMGFKK